jgi:hypothetical protein
MSKQIIQRSSQSSKRLQQCAMVIFAVLLSGCAVPERGSEEYWFNKLKDSQRQQCRQLPEPLASSCLLDVSNRSYDEFIKQRQQSSVPLNLQAIK